MSSLSIDATTLVLPAPAPDGGGADAAATAEHRITLFDLEERLQVLTNTADIVPVEQEQEFLADFEATLLAAKDKRDRVAWFLSYSEAQSALCASEIARLKARQQTFDHLVERLEGYVLKVVLRQEPVKGKYPKLEGNHCSFGAQRNPATVVIADESSVPTRCKTITVTMPAPAWETLLDSLDLELRAQTLDVVAKPQSAVVKSLVKDEIQAAVPDWKKLLETQPSVFADSLPGCMIAAGEMRLVRK